MRTRGHHEVGQRQPARPPVRLADAGDHAGHGDGRRPDVEDLVRPAEGHREGVEGVRVEPAAGRAEPRHGDEEVEERRGAVGVSGQQEAAGARAREGALGDGRGERRRAHGVDRAAALGEGLGAGPGGQAVAGRDHPDGRVGAAARYAASSGSSKPFGRRTIPVELGVELGRRLGLDVEDPGAAPRPASACVAAATGPALARGRRVGKVEARHALGPA